jgi:hypothetical protein
MNRCLVAIVALFGIAIGIWLSNGLASAEAPALPIQSATASELAIQGVSLTQPSDTPVIARSQAINAALAGFPRTTIREVFLVELTDTHTVPHIHTLSWGVSLNPSLAFQSGSGGPPPGVVQSPTQYLIVFFDAKNGQFLEGIQSGKSS